MITIESILKEHSFFKDLPSKYFDFIVGCASNVVFKKRYELVKRLMGVFTQRLEVTRLQLLDVYNINI